MSQHSEFRPYAVEAPHAAGASLLGPVGELAQFFPQASPVRLPVEVECESGAREKTTIEFGTPDEVLFATSLVVEFGERLKVSNADRSLAAEVVVVALQFQGGRTAVAARFAHRVPNWIVKL